MHPDAALKQLSNSLNALYCRSRKAVELADNERVAICEPFQQLLKLWPVHCLARKCLGYDLLTAILRQRRLLLFETVSVPALRRS